MNRIEDRSAALEYLMGRINYENTGALPYRSNQLKLDRMQRLLSRLGDPHLQSPTIHIAGTKGKGSTASMTARILTEAGLKTGLYSSPHLERLEERFTVDGEECGEQEFVALVSEVAEGVAKLDQQCEGDGESGPTFFEITTALAWLIFARRQVDCAVVEVGLGGRLDSTNVCAPTVTAITSISLDHTRQLGDRISSIAREKAGIIKPGAPVVLGPLCTEAATEIRAIAQERGCSIHSIGESFRVGAVEHAFPQRFDYEQGDVRLEGLELPLQGEHQVTNAALAIYLAQSFCRRTELSLSSEAIRRGLKAARCPARVELLSQSPHVIVDAAHNPASAAALRAAIELLPPRCSERTLVFATSRDKDAVAMLKVLAPSFSRIVLTRFRSNPRSTNPLELEQLLGSGEFASKVELHVDPDPTRAWREAFASCPASGLVCVAGSFFLAADLRSSMKADVRDRSQSSSPSF